MDSGETRIELNRDPAASGTEKWIGHVDGLDGFAIKGWVFTQDIEAQRHLKLEIYFRNVCIAEISPSFVRGDLVDFFGSAAVGFSLGLAEFRTQLLELWVKNSNKLTFLAELKQSFDVRVAGTHHYLSKDLFLYTPRFVEFMNIFQQDSGPLSVSGPRDERSLHAAAAEKLAFHCDAIRLSPDGRIAIDGWAAGQSKISRIEVFFDGDALGDATCGLPRRDVGRIYPKLPFANESGFTFSGKVADPVDGWHLASLHFELENSDRVTIDLDVEVTELELSGTDIPVAEETMIVRVDDMMIVNGRAGRLITSGFNLVGWSIAREGITDVQIEIDGVTIGKAYYGMRREDIPGAYPDWPDTLLSGFALAVPAKLLKNGISSFRVIARDKAGNTACLTFDAEIKKEAPRSGPQILRRKIGYVEVAAGLRLLKAAAYQPVFCALMFAGKLSDSYHGVLKTLQSLAAQGYPNWQITVLVSDEAVEAWQRAVSADIPPESSDRIFIRGSAQLLQPPGASGFPAEDGEPGLAGILPAGNALFGLLAPGDELACDALLSLALANIGTEPADLLYGDDRRFEPNSESATAYFKPDWNPDLLLSQNYLGRCWFATRALVARAGLDASTIRSKGCFDTVLRLSEQARNIRHIPRLLLQEAPHRQNSPNSRDSQEQERKALRAAMRRRDISGSILPGCAPHIHHLKRKLTRPGRVSIIMPSIGARDLIKISIPSIRAMTSYDDFEIIVVDNIRGKKLSASQQEWKAWFRANADIVVPVNAAFNWSRLNNLGAAAATGEYLLFLNDDIEVLDPDWLQALMEHAQRPEVGVVGPLLLYPDKKVQHAGLFLSRKNIGTARHAFRFAGEDDIGYFGLARTQRNMIGVTGACMMSHRTVFDAVGGFNEAHSVVNNDLDFCLRIHRSGRLVVYTPHTRLIHHELASRATLKDTYDASHFLAEWGDLCMQGDPFYNPNLTSDFDDLSFEDEPLREVHAGFPLGNAAQIRRILAIKLDHIGDLVTALPAMRRLKQHFPQAHLTALVGRSAVGIARLESAIDEIIDFEFFNARSSLGYKKISKKQYAALQARLQQGRFDLAVDLRKLGDTRHVLQLSGAPILAGIDTDRRFPWLDYADEWERDPLYTNKRNHVAADFLNLVDGLANAFRQDRQAILLAPGQALPGISPALAEAFAELFAGEYALVHPASGTPMRQWPPEYFARLVDLLVQRSGIKVAIMGGPDETAIAAQVLAHVTSTSGVYNLVGRSRLGEVPAIMARSVLFIGNNSGPKHIAAGLGVPTVGVHSGVIASEEWGPLGPDAVALRRDMSCSPCYRGKVEDCHRSLACVQTLPPHFVYEVCRKMLVLRRKTVEGG
jgi:ADP-heptose:LPS heptosyltransferase/GT2 family glycosyltransferase